MESLGSIKLRLASVGSTVQITRALQMVSVSKMTKAQQAATSSSDYTDEIKSLIRRTLASIANSDKSKVPSSLQKYISGTEEKPVLVVLFAPTKGFCGALIGTMLKSANHLVKELQSEGKDVVMIGLQKKAKYIIDKLYNVETRAIFADQFRGTSMNMIAGDVSYILKGFLDGEYSKVILLYPKFINTFSYEVSAEQVLPVDLSIFASGDDGQKNESEFIVEPNVPDFLSKALKKYISTVFLNAALHTKASEHSARMIAMKNATESAEKLGDSLRLKYNRIRQEGITGELLDIVGGIAYQGK